MTDPAKRRPNPQPSADELWKLIFCSDPAKIAVLEAQAGQTQADAVDHFIENSCWREDVPHLTGGRGTATERRAALLAVWKWQKRGVV